MHRPVRPTPETKLTLVTKGKSMPRNPSNAKPPRRSKRHAGKRRKYYGNANASVSQVLGVTPSKTHGKNMSDATALERAEAAKQHDRSRLASLGSPHANQLYWTPEGSRVYAQERQDEGKEAEGEEEPHTSYVVYTIPVLFTFSKRFPVCLRSPDLNMIVRCLICIVIALLYYCIII